MRRSNEEWLARCDAVIVFYGAGDELWKRSVDNDLQKVGGLRGDIRPLIVYTYLAAIATDAKRDLIEMQEPRIVNGLEGFSEDAMRPFIETLRGA